MSLKSFVVEVLEHVESKRTRLLGDMGMDWREKREAVATFPGTVFPLLYIVEFCGAFLPK